MKNNIIYSLVLAASLSVFSYAQTGVGINTANPQGGIFHIDGSKDNNITGVPTAAQQQNDFYVDGATGRVGIGTTSPKVKLDLRNASNGEGAIGIGRGTTITATQAEEGAMKYDPTQSGNNAKIVYSNGKDWVPLWIGANPPQKVKVIAEKTTNVNVKVADATSPAVYGTAIGNTAVTTMTDNRSNYLVNWTKKYENDGTNDTTNFNATTGVFTAPRTGIYVATFSYTTAAAAITAASQIRTEAIWQRYDNSGNYNAGNLLETIKCVNSYMSPRSGSVTQIAGVNCTAAFQMQAGQKLVASAWFSLGGNRALNNTSTGGYNNLTIVEQ